MSNVDPRWLLYGAAIAGVVYVAYKIVNAAPAAAKAVGQAIDPTDPRNLAYRATNAVGAAVSGDTNWDLGGSIWDIFNSDANKKIADMLKGAGAPSASYDEMDRLARRYPQKQPDLLDPATYELASTQWGLGL